MGAVKMFGCEACAYKDKGIFCQLNHPTLKTLGENKIMTHYKKGQTIFLEGSTPQGVYCINSGKIKLTKISHEGKESIVRIAGPGDILGHRSLLSHENFGATASVLEDSTVCFLEKDYFQKILQEEPSVSLQLIQKLSSAMGAVESRYAAMSQKSVKVRLAQLLLQFKDQYGIEGKKGWKLDIRLTREEIASMVGTTPETIIRFMSELKDTGILAQEGKIMILTDLTQLQAIAHSTNS